MKNSLNPIRNPTVFNNRFLPHSSFTRSNRGFTLIEALVGITVSGMVFASAAPVIMFAIATRLQTYQAEQAIQIAQGEINRIQVLMAQGVAKEEEVGKLPPAVAPEVELPQVVAPTITVSSETNVDNANKALEIDLDKDPNTTNDQFLLQTFRDPGMRFNQGSAANQLAVFQVGVRVYSILAKDNLGNLQTDMVSLNITENFGQQRIRPLAVMYTEVSRSDLKFSLQRYKDYLNQD